MDRHLPRGAYRVMDNGSQSAVDAFLFFVREVDRHLPRGAYRVMHRDEISTSVWTRQRERRRKMKRNLNRFCFIAFAIPLCLGIPGQAQVANGGCDGRSSIHRKPDDVVSALSALWHKARIASRGYAVQCIENLLYRRFYNRASTQNFPDYRSYRRLRKWHHRLR